GPGDPRADLQPVLPAGRRGAPQGVARRGRTRRRPGEGGPGRGRQPPNQEGERLRVRDREDQARGHLRHAPAPRRATRTAAADRLSLEQTGELATFESTHRALAVSNLSDLDPPRPLYLLLFTHPTPPERIANARRWTDRAGAAPTSPSPPTTG